MKRKITQEELDKIIQDHQHWMNEDCKGWENMQADLCDCDLRDVNLFKADLRWANLRDVNLFKADLRWANLGGADLSNADLTGTDLSNANLFCADLSNANLTGTNLSNANLRYNNLTNVKGLEYTLACPETGSFIGYKKCFDYTLSSIREFYIFFSNSYIVTLEIPEDAKRSSSTSNKCRCSKAKVLSIETIDGQKADIDTVCSHYDKKFTYKIGETVEVNDFDDNRWDECSSGIHFFMTKEEAIEY